MAQVALPGSVPSSCGRSLITGTSRVCITETTMPTKASTGTRARSLWLRGPVGRRARHEGRPPDRGWVVPCGMPDPPGSARGLRQAEPGRAVRRGGEGLAGGGRGGAKAPPRRTHSPSGRLPPMGRGRIQRCPVGLPGHPHHRSARGRAVPVHQPPARESDGDWPLLVPGPGRRCCCSRDQESAPGCAADLRRRPPGRSRMQVAARTSRDPGNPGHHRRPSRLRQPVRNFPRLREGVRHYTRAVPSAGRGAILFRHRPSTDVRTNKLTIGDLVRQRLPQSS